VSRNIQQSFRVSAESSFADEVNLIFLRIVHPSITTIRVVNDTKDYILAGNTYTGFPFDIEILTDDETPPTARLAIQNVDPRIGDSIRTLLTPPQLSIELYSSADFNLNADPRTPFGTPTLVYGADFLFLINVSVDVMTISAQIVGWDYLQRVWPSERATIANFPGLFRS
jgi:Domain of unknown function (DUF1833)